MTSPKVSYAMKLMDEVKGLRPNDSDDLKRAALQRLQRLAEDATPPCQFDTEGFIMNPYDVLRWIRGNPAERQIFVWKPGHPHEHFDGVPDEDAEFEISFNDQASEPTWVVRYVGYDHISLGLQTDDDVAQFLAKCKVRGPTVEREEERLSNVKADGTTTQFELEDVYNMHIHL